MSTATQSSVGTTNTGPEIGGLGTAKATARAAGNIARERTPSRDRSAGGIRFHASRSIQQVVIVATTLIVGIVVLGNISGSMPNLAANNSFNGTIGNVSGTINSSLVLAGVVPIVIIAGTLLFYVGNFGSGGGRR